MADKIVSLFNTTIPQGEPHEGLVELLEEMLASARSGQIVGAACAFLNHDGAAVYHIIGRVGGFSMQGALDCARHELLRVNTGVGE